jgi:hypothetical protein
VLSINGVLNPRSRNVSTMGPCGTSISTWIILYAPPLVSINQSAISPKAEPELSEAPDATVNEVHAMVLRRPVDASDPLFFSHSFFSSRCEPPRR